MKAEAKVQLPKTTVYFKETDSLTDEEKTKTGTVQVRLLPDIKNAVKLMDFDAVYWLKWPW